MLERSTRGAVELERLTVEHDRSGAPARAFVIGRDGEGVRTAAPTPPGDVSSAAALSLRAVPEDRHARIGRRVALDRSGGQPAITGPAPG